MMANSEMAVSSGFSLSGQEGFKAIVIALEDRHSGDGECLETECKCGSETPGARHSRGIQRLFAALVLCLVWSLPIGLRAQSVVFTHVQTEADAGALLSGVTADGAGNVFAVNYELRSVVEFPVAGGPPVTVANPTGGTSGIAIDPAGNLFVAQADSTPFGVLEIPAGGGAPKQVGAGLSHASGVAVDTAGDLFIADSGNSRVVEVPVGGGPQITIGATGLGSALGVAVDAVGNVYVSDSFHDRVVKVAVGGGQTTVRTTGLFEPTGVAVDGADNIFIADYGNNRVVEVPANGGPQITIGTGSGAGAVQGVAVDGDGDIFFTNPGQLGLVEIQTHAVNFGSLNVCPAGQSSPAPCSQTLTLNYNITSGGDLGTGVALTMGAPNLDFKIASGSTCVGHFNAGATCSVTVTFAPTKAGIRQGAVQITDDLGNALATTYVTGTGIGPQIAFAPSRQNTVGSGFTQPFSYPSGVAANGAGDVFVADTYGVYKVPAGGGPTTTVGTGLVSPTAVAVDGAGNVYIVDQGNYSVYEVPAGGGAQITVGSNIISPVAVAVDGMGNVFILDYGRSCVVKMPAAGGAETFLGTGLQTPLGIALDGAGNLYIADSGNGRIVEVLAEGSAQTTVVSGLESPQGISVDAAGNLYIADGSSIVELLVKAGTHVSLGTGLNGASGVFVDASGNVYVADTNNGRVVELPRSQAPALSFASTKVGVVSADSPQTVEVLNIGNQPLIFNTPTTGANPSYPAGFPENTSDSNLCSSSSQVGQGASCDVSLNFIPTIAGTNSGSAVLTDNALNAAAATQSIAVSGTGVGQTISLSATSLSYPSTTVGTSSGSQSVTMTNTGTAALSITSIAVTGANASSFVFANSCGSSVAAGANCTIHGHFAPTTAGALKAAVTVTYTSAGSPSSIALSGTGVKPPVTLSATSLSYSSTTVGTSSGSQSVTMTNTGTATLTITSIAVTGANASSFIFANTCGTSLTVGASCSIHGHFAPTTAGAWKAAITITDSAGTSPQSIALSGTGKAAAAPVTLSATSLLFGTVKVGTSSASQSVTMTNTGTAALTITSIAVTGTNASSFVFANTCGASLAVGDSCTIHGHFAPTATGALKAAVTITDSAMGSPQNIALSGTGQ